MDSENYEAASEIGREMLALAQQWRNPELLAAAHAWMGFISIRLDFVASRSHCERALALMREMGPSTGAVSDITFSPAGTLSHLALSLANLGFPDQAVLRAREAIALARATPLEPACRANVVMTHLNLRNWELAREQCEALLGGQSENGLVGLIELAKAQHGMATAMLDDVDKGIAEIREAISSQSATLARFRATALRYLALACVKAGRAEEGLKALDEFDRSLTHRLASDVTRGELLLVQDPPDERGAERCFRRVIELARGQQGRLFELRAATCLARLLKRRGELKEAHEILAGIYAWFTEGFDTADLREAKALLDELTG
jgi:adenylate cyclase